LELSARTLNCLKRAHINRVGEILEKDRSELLKIRNFGEKSLDELYARLDERGFLPEQAQSQNGASAEESDTVQPYEDSEDDAPGDEESEVSE
jgi:DNA-directed RNA polymerase subunit alpha